jgi:hypothetical protein
MLNLFFKRKSKKPKSVLPNPNLEYKILFRKNAVRQIQALKGWKTDAAMARALGLTPQYITMLRNHNASVTATVITRLAEALNNVEGNWWIYFEIVPRGVKDPKHPVWQDERNASKSLNMEKFAGRVPYTPYSATAIERSSEYSAETESLKK